MHYGNIKDDIVFTPAIIIREILSINNTESKVCIVVFSYRRKFSINQRHFRFRHISDIHEEVYHFNAFTIEHTVVIQTEKNIV